MTRLNEVAPPGVRPHQRARRRVRVLAIVLLLGFLGVIVRLVYIQIIRAEAYRARAREQYEAEVVLPAARGYISDRNGRVLVSNTMYVSYGADPSIARGDRDDIALQFARVFNKPREAYAAQMRDASRRFVWLERGVKPSFSSRIPAGEFRGLVTLEEPKRLYHYERAAGQLLGVTGVDNAGLSGLEQQFDRWLRGRDGSVTLQRDALRRTRPTVDYPRIDPVDGKNLVLTIDADLQTVVEEELERGVERTQAESGQAIMVDPATGEILAMANYPSVNPNNLANLNLDALRNRVITDTFEPGSIFKVVTISAILETRCVRLDEVFNAENGVYRVPVRGAKFRNITDTHPFASLTFQKAIEQSSNIVMAKAALRVGPETFFRTARAFGFGATTGIELPAEANGLLKKPGEWSGTTLQSMAYGYDVSATTLQIVMAYAAVANRGVLMKPYVVRQVLDAQGEVIMETQPQRVRPVITPENAALLTGLLERVVEHGTGTPAKVPGLRIAGKTGTSRQAANGRYALGDYTASFVGYFPADDPKIVCLVLLDRPRSGSYYGGQASAPIFKAIAEKTRAMAGRLRGMTTVPAMEYSNARKVPNVMNLRTDVAAALLEAEKLQAEIAGEGKIVVGQSPAPGTALAINGKVTLRTNDGARSAAEGYTLVPDLRGLTVRRAVNQLSAQQLDVTVVGSGTVQDQSPSPGQKVRQGTQVKLRCEPRPLPAANS